MANRGKQSIVVLLLLVLGAGGWYARQRTSRCVVGVNGADATVTITGFGSSSACEDMVREYPNASYLRQTPPDGGVLCEVQRDQKTFIVRDRGTFMLVGRGICSSLLDKQPAKNR